MSHQGRGAQGVGGAYDCGVAPIRQVAPGGGVEFEVDPASGHTAWRVAGRRATVVRARAVAGDEAVDRILRDVVAQLRVAALLGGDDRGQLRALAGRIWLDRNGTGTAKIDQGRLF